MITITRRAALALGAAAVAPSYAKKKNPAEHAIGVQLYTVRTILPKDPDAVLKGIADLGYEEVEGGQATLAAQLPIYRKYGLKCPSIGLETPLVTGVGTPPQGVTLDSALAQAKEAGAEFVGIGYSGPQKDADAYKRVCDGMNKTGEAAKKVGLEFTYHHHAYEFGGEPGKRAWDYYMQYWDPNAVKLCMDVYWLSIAGQDPAAMITQYAGRLRLIHLKDKAFGTPVQYDQNVKPYSFKEVGTGVVDFPAVLKAAKAANVRHYFVEQDFTPGNPLDSLAISYKNLRKFGL